MLVVEPHYYRVSLNPSSASEYYKGWVHTSAGESDSRASKRGNIKTSSPPPPIFTPSLFGGVSMCDIPICVDDVYNFVSRRGRKEGTGRKQKKVFAGGKEEEEPSDQLHM